jgi:uncharacterized protein YprB with RNaseH-like and TPR domain
MDLEKRLYEALKKHIESPKAPKPDIFRLPPVGAVRTTSHGPIWMLETGYDVGYLHGRVELGNDLPNSILKIIDPLLLDAKYDFKNAAVIDTETTGLAGGTGTYPFIIGIGFWNKNQFVVRQYILRDFSDEPAQLSAFVDDLLQTSCMLTYNGKTFDIPLLRTRFRINRMEIPFNNHSHLDFVHPCRRIYRRHFDSFNLSLLEEKVLGFERADDVPGHLIPRIYFDYLQNRNDELLLPILNHNRNDIVSLYLLVQETWRRIDLALSEACNDDPFLLSLGHIFYKAGDYDQAKHLLSGIKRRFAPKDIIDESILLQSRAAKKTRDWDAAVEIWSRMVKMGKFGCYPYVELAKHCEHRLKDYKAALDHTNNAMRYIEFEREFIAPAAYKSLLESLKIRHKRLLKRIEKIS